MIWNIHFDRKFALFAAMGVGTALKNAKDPLILPKNGKYSLAQKNIICYNISMEMIEGSDICFGKKSASRFSTAKALLWLTAPYRSRNQKRKKSIQAIASMKRTGFIDA